jgi:uncharacterized membrane protein
VDDGIHDAIVASPRWSAAEHHAVRSRPGMILVACGVGMLAVTLLLWPSIVAAAEEGDRSGLTFVIIVCVAAGLVIVGGLTFLALPLRRHPGVVLGTTTATTTNAKRRGVVHRRVHLWTRGKRMSLSVSARQIDVLTPGLPVIVFARASRVEDAWPLDLDAGAWVRPA